jgi:hypothetical protein
LVGALTAPAVPKGMVKAGAEARGA